MGILEIIAVLLLLGWLGGFAFNVAGNVVHVLLILALIIFALRFFRRAV